MTIKKAAVFLILTVFLFHTSSAFAESGAENNYKRTSVLMEASTGTVLYGENEHEVVKIGTMCKLMTILLAAEAVDSGRLDINKTVAASSHANSMQGAQIWLMPGEEMTVEDLLKGIIIGNANDASVAIAEELAGTEQAFTDDMNARAFELGMRNTRFANCSGFGTEEQYSTAYDIALLCRELAAHDGTLNKYMTCWRDFLRDGATELVNENELVKNYKGIIGFKAGYSPGAGACIAAGAERGSSVFIAVSLGLSSKDERPAAAKELLAKGFEGYEVTNPAFSNEHLMPVKVHGGVDSAVEIEAKELSSLVVNKSKSGDITSVIFLPKYINAPVRKGQAIGLVAFYIDDSLVYETELVTISAVEELTLGKAFKKIFLNLLK